MNPQTLKRRNDFISSERGVEAIELLKTMVLDTSYNTEPSYSTNTELYPDNLMPFFDKHLEFLSNHSEINPLLYLSNLRLMTRIEVSSMSY